MEKPGKKKTTGLEVSPYAGRLSHFYENWLPITRNNKILKWLKGYCIPFTKPPSQIQVPVSKRVNITDSHIIQAEISHLLKIGAIQNCSAVKNQFVSKFFLADKPNGKKRFILNLKKLNNFVSAPHFKLEDARTASRLIQYKSYAATIDLKDAYYLVPINNNHRKYLRFSYNSKLYEFTCLPFGLASAPYTFTKLMKPAVEHLRASGVTCVNYLDDFLILGSSKEECFRNMHLATSLLKRLGFLLNTEKSMLSPHTRFKFLGFIFDSEKMTIELPFDKREKIQKWIKKLSKRKCCKILTFAKFLGLLTSACPAVKYGWLYTKTLEREKYLALMSNRQNYNSKVYISQEILDELQWWFAKTLTATNELKKDKFDLEIFSDASLSGWGVFCQKKTAHGWWSNSETDKHINYLELLAIYYGLKCFASHLLNCNILIRTDNTTALSYVNRMGSVRFPELNLLSRKIWQWCENRNIWIFASYIPSSENWQADQASRTLRTETEWTLNNVVFKKIIDRFGIPEIDLFASVINRKCKRYCSWQTDPEAETIDAFTVNWCNLKFYAFPPFSLILRTLQKIINDKATGIVVVPFWKSQPWYPLFRKMIKKDPLFFGPSDNIVCCPFSKIKHPLAKDLILVAALLSGRHFDEAAFLTVH